MTLTTRFTTLALLGALASGTTFSVHAQGVGAGTAAPASATTGDGTEERICRMNREGVTTNPAPEVAFNHCRRGDIIFVAWLVPGAVARVCDFSKNFTTGEHNRTWYCVYIGRWREEVFPPAR